MTWEKLSDLRKIVYLYFDQLISDIILLVMINYSEYQISEAIFLLPAVSEHLRFHTEKGSVCSEVLFLHTHTHKKTFNISDQIHIAEDCRPHHSSLRTSSDQSLSLRELSILHIWLPSTLAFLQFFYFSVMKKHCFWLSCPEKQLDIFTSSEESLGPTLNAVS